MKGVQPMTNHTYPVTIGKEGEQYYAYSKDLPGVYGLGSSIEEAQTSVLEAIHLYAVACEETGRPIPAKLAE
jgi:predicted RNase H-like HicB family nuclease